MQYSGGVQYRGGYRDACGDLFSTMGVVLSTVGNTQYRGGYHEYRGGGKSFAI